MNSQLPAIVPLNAYQGDTWTQRFRLKFETEPLDLTNATIACWAITAQKDVIELGADITDPPNGEIELSVGPDGLSAGAYTYDVEIKINGVVTTWIRGSLSVEKDITNVI